MKRTWTDNELIDAVANSFTYKEVATKLKLKAYGQDTAFRKRIISLNISIDHFNTQSKTEWTNEQLTIAVAESKSYREVSRRLMQSSSTPKSPFRKRIIDLKLDTSHFLPHTNPTFNKAIPLEKVLIVNSTYSNNDYLKKRLYKEGLKQPFCEFENCGQGEDWRGHRISLILDHINGIRNDNRIENLRIVCPNCNATLDTHGGRNKRKQKGLPNKKLIPDGRIRIDGRPKTRKVERPEKDLLLKQVEMKGYLATSRIYGVSDNTIRKWVLIEISDSLQDEVNKNGVETIATKYKLSEERIVKRLKAIEKYQKAIENPTVYK